MNAKLEMAEKISLWSGVFCAAAFLAVMWRFEPGVAFWVVKKYSWILYANLAVFLILKGFVYKGRVGKAGWGTKLIGRVVEINRAFALFSVAFIIVIALVEFFRK